MRLGAAVSQNCSDSDSAGGSHRPEKAGANHSHPRNPAVVLLQVRLLFDHEGAVWVVAAEAVPNPLAIRERIRLHLRRLVELVLWLEPLLQDDVDYRGAISGFPTPIGRQSSEVDVIGEQCAESVGIPV